MTLAWMRLRNTMNGQQRHHDNVQGRDEAGAPGRTAVQHAVLLGRAGAEQYQTADDADHNGIAEADGIAIALPSPSVIVGALPETRTREEPDAEC